MVPPIRIRDNVQLKPDEYVIKIRGVEVDRGEALIGYYLALNPGTVEEEIEGIDTTEPTFGLPAKWITEIQREEAERLGYHVVKTPAVIVTHLMEVIRSHAGELLRRQDVQNLIENVRRRHPAVVEELIPNLLSVGTIQKVLQNLLNERVPVRDMVMILETLADYAPMTKDANLLTEYVRTALGPSLAKQYENGRGRITALTLDPALEEMISDLLDQAGRTGEAVGLPPDVLGKLYDALTPKIQEMVAGGQKPVVLCSPTARPVFRRMIQNMFPNLAVLSYGELSPKMQIEQVGTVSV